MHLDYRFEARLTDSVEIGPVPGGVRVRGVDQITIRDDGSVELDIRETIETERGAISADVRGYAIPHSHAAHLHVIKGYALFRTAAPQYAAYNDAVLAIEGTADMAARTIDVEGRAFAAERARQHLEQLAIAA
jgi:hypothetical protein